MPKLSNRITGDSNIAIEGIDTINGYSHRSAQRNIKQYGDLEPIFEIRDVVQAVHELLADAKSLGQQYAVRIGRARRRKNYFLSRAHEELKKAVRQAIGQHRDKFSKRKQRGLPEQKSLSSADALGYDPREDIECAMSVTEAMAQLSPHEQEIIQLRLEGYTYEEIADRLDLEGRRAVCKTIRPIFKKLALALCDVKSGLP